jgi:hypothetical protein
MKKMNSIILLAMAFIIGTSLSLTSLRLETSSAYVTPEEEKTVPNVMDLNRRTYQKDLRGLQTAL